MSTENTEEQYISKLDYPYLLLVRIMKILDVMDRGETGQKETQNLLAILKPSWIEKNRKEFDEKSIERDRLLEELRKNKENMGTKSYYTEMKRIHHGYNRFIIQKVIEIMDKNELLLLRQKKIREGGFFEE